MNIRPAALIVKNKKILLLKYTYNNNVVYNLPGGNHENNEALSDTLYREMVEELGIIINVEELILVAETDRKNNDETVLHLVFNCKIIENEPIINSNETSADEATWLPLDQLVEVNLYPNIGKQIMKTFENENEQIYLGKIQQPWF